MQLGLPADRRRRRGRSCPPTGGDFQRGPVAEPPPGQAAGARSSRAVRSRIATATDVSVRDRGPPVEPVHVPASAIANVTRPARGRRDRRARVCRARRRGPRAPVHDAAPPPDRGLARASPRATCAARDPARRRAVPARRSCAALARQFNAMADRLEESVDDHPPRPRPQPRLPGRRVATSCGRRSPRCARSTSCSPSGPATTRGAGGVPRLEPRPARAARLARPEPARALEARLGARAARPAARRPAGGRRVGRRAGRAGRAAPRRRADASTCRDAPLRIRHDPQRIGQVVTNLVGNAIKFTRAGRLASTSRVAATADGGARIEVADTGVGIEPAELPRIFDRFYRGSRANEARGSGCGLGLAIVRSIVDMHRGTVAVESRLGAGHDVHGDRCRATRGARRARSRRRRRRTRPPSRPAKMADSSPTAAPTLNRDPAP